MPGNFPFSYFLIAGTRSTCLLLLPSSSPRTSQGTRIYFDAMWNEKCYGTSKVEDVSAGEWGSMSRPACWFVFTVDVTAKNPAIQPASVPAALGHTVGKLQCQGWVSLSSYSAGGGKWEAQW
jgi:hypothetical protein